MKPEVQFRLRIRSGADIAVGPGKIELLEAIASSGSITAAAKSLGMSYRRAWLLVDTMNRCFKGRVVETEAGEPAVAEHDSRPWARRSSAPTDGSKRARRRPARRRLRH